MMDALVVALMLWVSQATGLPFPKQMPTVYLLGPASFCQIYYEGRPCPKDAALQVVAFYDRGAMYLHEGFDPHKLFDDSVLVHELVHFLQDVNGKHYACPGEAEPLAYKTQAKWLKAVGDPTPWKTMGIDLFTVAGMTGCDE